MTPRVVWCSPQTLDEALGPSRALLAALRAPLVDVGEGGAHSEASVLCLAHNRLVELSLCGRVATITPFGRDVARHMIARLGPEAIQ